MSSFPRRITNQEKVEETSRDDDRVEIRFPGDHDEPVDDTSSCWIRVAQLNTSSFVPEVDDEVLVGFEHGDMRHPYVLGSLYNGNDAPPSESPAGYNEYAMDDSAGYETVGTAMSEVVSNVDVEEDPDTDGDWLVA